jgi:hypothetical protein
MHVTRSDVPCRWRRSCIGWHTVPHSARISSQVASFRVRCVCCGGEEEFLLKIVVFVEVSDRADGESEYADGGGEEDELLSDVELTKVCHRRMPCDVQDWRILCIQDNAESSSSAKLAKLQESAERRRRKQKTKVSCRQSAKKWTRQRYGLILQVISSLQLTSCKITDAVKRYSYLLGQTELFKHFVDIKVCSDTLAVVFHV